MQINNSAEPPMTRTSYLFLIATLLQFFLITPNLSAQEETYELKENLVYLASDTLEGRYPISEGNFLAAEFIAQKFQDYGLKPYKDSYLQNFLFPGDMVASDDSNVEFNVYIPRPGVPKKYIKPVNKKWEINTDWFPMRFSASGEVSGEMVFVGYGISSQKLGYDDYAGMDVKDKIVIILADSSEKFPRDDFFGQFSELKYKAENAKKHGAKGLIFVKSQSDSANTEYPFYPEIGYLDAGIVAIQANRTSIAYFFPKKQPLSQVELEIFNSRKPFSFLIENAEVTIKLTLDRKEIEIPNVIAKVEGTENPDKYVVVGAHFDHLGREKEETFYWQPLWQERLFPIHNGADDNASGVAAMLELAKKLQARPIDKTVIFVAFNANEQSIAGSKAFLENSGIDPKDISFMINLDMVGRMSGIDLNVLGADTSPELKSLINKTAHDDSTNINFVEGGYDLSDEHSFFANKIPAVRFATQHHLDYHTPTDDASKINYKGLEKVVSFCETMLRLSNGLNVTYTSSDLSHPVSSYDRIGHQAWMGILPVFVLHTEGFRIAGVADKSPAKKAGFNRNDVITMVDSVRVYSFADYSEALSKYKAGDTVTFTYIRNGKENQKKVTLGAR
jgi:aminopeptidase YwaD